MSSRKDSSLAKLIHTELKSVVDEVLQECPRFRILVIGKAGVGKSSLINAAFDVDLANVSHDRAGVSSINTEITSQTNDRFVLHDSQGFAPGEVENFNTVKNFILQRTNMPKLPDRLHAIWLCLETPATNNALLERGDLEFLNLPLGRVPVIVAFTKLDILFRRFEDELYNEEDYTDEATFDALVWSHVEPKLNKTCLAPLREATLHLSSPLTSVAVSTKMPASDSLKKLMEVTQKHVDSSVYLIWALAQRVNVDMKIEGSIRVGKHKYWRGLASSLFFAGKSLKSCLDVIHHDIIAVWNFSDDDKYLQSDEFKAVITDLVTDLEEPAKSRGRAATFDSAVSTSTASTLSNRSVIDYVAPAARVGITVPVIFARWVYGVYSAAPHVIRCLMGYIVDLIIVMQSLFWMMKKRGNGYIPGLPIGHKLIDEAAAVYNKSGDLVRVHKSISKFVTSMTALRLSQKDEVLDEIVRIIHKNRFLPPVSV